MKPLVIFLCYLFFAALGGKAQDVLNHQNLQHIPKEGMLLDKGWKFHTGDINDWKNQDFDDKDWNTININQPVASFLQLIKGNICWLRMPFTLDGPFQDSLFAISINQYGASEVYIDGKLIKRLGKPGNQQERINFNPHNQPILFLLNKQPVHMIALRFASDIPSSDWIRQQAIITPLSVRIQPLSSALGELKATSIQSRIQIGIATLYGVFGLLFLLLFAFYRRQRLNLFFGLFGLSVLLQITVTAFLYEGQYNIDTFVLLQILIDFLSRAIGANILLFMIMALFNQIKRWQWWYVSYLLTIDFFLSNFFKAEYELVNSFFHFSFIVLCLWLFAEVTRRRKKENWVIGILAFLVALVNTSGMLKEHAGIDFVPFVDILFPLLVFPSMAIYLALKFANAQTSLERQLVQVKDLSEENIRQEQEKQQLLAKQNETLERQVKERTAQITVQNETLQSTLQELKATQRQLIQQEKMASLGELTAGIAHEIQNPLNFVNNFSEVNKEMLEELKAERLKPKAEREDETQDELINDVIANEQKINHHGKRADAIVKGMLQHSRSSTGVKELTDINALCDEYLRLSYHGLRAKDKEVNAIIKTDFDDNVGKINIIPQDIGRVLLNLYNNAFYAVSERKRNTVNEEKDGNFISYEPTVSVTTKKSENSVNITVGDNGNGIPQKVIDKIFQPFFTTKPTGEGTGLGLSLSYDIVKAHGGEIKVESKEGEGTAFVVELPLKEILK